MIYITYRILYSKLEVLNNHKSNSNTKFYSAIDEQANVMEASDDEYVEEEADVISLSNLTESEPKFRVNGKTNSTISTIFETSSARKSKHYQLFPLDKILDEEEKLVPWEKIKYTLVTMSVMVISTVILGNKDIQSFLDIEYCSSIYWILYF